MSLFHTVVQIDHHNAKVLSFDTDHVETEKISEHKVYTRQHNSGVRTEHEFFAEVCDALATTGRILVAGSRVAQASFKHYVDSHRPMLVSHIAGWETVDHPTEAELVAMARTYFAQHERDIASPPEAQS